MATTDQRAGFRLPWTSEQRSTADDGGFDGSGAADADGPEAAERPAADAIPVALEETVGSVPPASATAPAPVGRPANRLLADLTRAMQAAAETARTQTLGQFATEAKTFVEEIHGRSASQVSELRKRTDDDVASIREWSKAEIARVREETEVRIGGRKTELEHHLELHAAVIEREIERIHGQVAAFETDMERFFERLRAEEDPTRIATMAGNLPEPPTFLASAVDVDEIVAGTVPPALVADAPDRQAEATLGAAAMELVDAGDGPETAVVDDAREDSEPAPVDAAGEAAEVAAQIAVGAAEVAVDASEGSVTDSGADAGWDRDPRLEALGASAPDAAEAEAATAVGDNGDYAVIDDDALSARLADLVPERQHPAAERPAAERQATATMPVESTQIVVVGLVSVSSIAGFKRHLTRLPGVRSVGVSSGPDGDFLFAVNHDPALRLGDAIPSLPGFGARITNSGDGVLNVSARDPESEG
ncbi:MAG: hypothetical protein IVW53_04470 [Chloroflexi bacterium]|nr:hypothetical protein [Chloroflexota bacterium]